jgi:hypothetical protein
MLGYLFAALLVIIPTFFVVGALAVADNLTLGKSEFLAEQRMDFKELLQESSERFFNCILEHLPLKWRSYCEWEMQHW